MATRKITLTIITALAACTFSACNGHTKTPLDTNAGGSDTSHTTDNRRKEVSGVAPKTGTTNGAKSNNGSTAQGQTGADSAYQKATQKSM